MAGRQAIQFSFYFDLLVGVFQGRNS
ncbi:hypothetical protein CCACVL1_13080 [Corchorus capsularis]|uniref:Uncharacterized protein n=1 Tax=Corchorus capsularis TaxID=210143 RepID=A0A1R3ICL1_COCAP|nr:hypothetical protein CCACVL1_13080 [Corchorus capsularis]